MANSLAPAFIKVNYHSISGPHSMLIPTLAANVAPTPSESTIDTHAGGTIAWDDMAEALLTELADQMSTSSAFDGIFLFTQADADADPVLITGKNITIAGTNAAPGWEVATQLTINAKSENGGNVRLTLLDFASGGQFTKTSVLAGSGLEAVVAEWGLLANGWSSRDNGRPSIFLSATRTLNERLRRAYRIS